ncbi:hypothetical protein SCOR_03285 [Sulfidibacter corallicola]|uniref:Peptidase S74 domain-containing protein n=1 Tax=Sulfidibacter corallicola TaxID=2818388 RepID=A0A8A4TER2_SULCO|nr:hypothetical protein [Sulfidibacter corallicola]QTD48446.1 hypothetical protein J3U87_22940 [Sulfidibacter corallicola]
MRNVSHLLAKDILIGFILFAVVPQLMAAEDFAELEADPVGMNWNLSEEYDMVFLTISGPNYFEAEYTFEHGERVGIHLYDERGNLLEDGVYTYQMTAYRLESSRIFDILARVRENQSPEEMRLALRTFGDPTSVQVQTGTFAIQGRVPLVPHEDETTDQDELERALVYTDDIIVMGSECVGVDCEQNESFSFDTIRLKENNLRIHFQDTSSNTVYPTVDWRIVANDSNPHGNALFAIENADSNVRIMTLRANAGENSLYVDDQGEVGLGTSNPQEMLHLMDGNSPSVRLDQDGSSGFTAQSWDLGGNETNFFIRDVTNSEQLPFRIRAGAGQNALYINTDNRIGFGLANPESYLHVKPAGAYNDMLRLETAGFPQVIYERNDANTPFTWISGMDNDRAWVIRPDDNSNNVFFKVDTQGDVTLYDDLTIDSLIANNTVFANNVSSPNATFSNTLTAQTITATTINYTNLVQNSPRGLARQVDTGVLLDGMENLDFYTYGTENGVVFAPNALAFNRLLGGLSANESKGGISIGNLATAAMAGVKELVQQLAARDEDIATLQDHAAHLEKRLIALEARLSECECVKNSSKKAGEPADATMEMGDR